MLFRPTIFPGGDKTGLEADDEDACWNDDGVRADGKCGNAGVGWICECEWCDFNWATDEIEPAPRPTDAVCEWCKLWISERLVREAPSSDWLLWTITLLLVACVWCDVDDGWPVPEISILLFTIKC